MRERFIAYLVDRDALDRVLVHLVERSAGRLDFVTLVRPDDRRQFWVQSKFHGEGDGWHRTMESAVKRLKVLRRKKLAALRREMSRLEAIDEVMVFEDSERWTSRPRPVAPRARKFPVNAGNGGR